MRLDDLMNIEIQNAAEVDWDEELGAGGPVKTFEIDEAGAWVDADQGLMMGVLVQQKAQEHGWDGVIKNPRDEGYEEVSEEASEYMNQFAPKGYAFGIDMEGSWGMFEDQEGLDKEVFEHIKGIKDTVAPAKNAEENLTDKFWPTDQDIKEEEKEEKDVDQLTDADVTGLEAGVPAGASSLAKVLDEKQEHVREASAILEQVTILSEFKDELHPIISKEIEVGDTVFIKPLRSFGEVIRIMDSVCKVKVVVNGKEMINPYWRHEIEVRD